jgi:hypothetical protein
MAKIGFYQTISRYVSRLMLDPQFIKVSLCPCFHKEVFLSEMLYGRKSYVCNV